MALTYLVVSSLADTDLFKVTRSPTLVSFTNRCSLNLTNNHYVSLISCYPVKPREEKGQETVIFTSNVVRLSQYASKQVPLLRLTDKFPSSTCNPIQPVRCAIGYYNYIKVSIEPAIDGHVLVEDEDYLVTLRFTSQANEENVNKG